MAGPDDEIDEDDWAAALIAQNGEGGESSLADEWGAALAEQGTTTHASDVAAEWATMIEDGETDNLPELAGNDRILNQDEIDGVLGFSLRELSASGAGGVRAIVDSGVVQYERLPMLEIVFDRMIRLLSTSLRNFFQDNVEVTLDNITSVRFGDYLNAIPLPTLLGVFRADAWENSGLVTVESNLAYSTLDLLLGGKRGGSSTRLDGRPFTSIEMQLVRRLVEIILTDLELSFQPLSPGRFAIDRIETNPRFATITRPANAAILISLKLDMDGRGGLLQILFPYATIEPIRELLMQSFMGEKLGRDHVWESHLATRDLAGRRHHGGGAARDDAAAEEGAVPESRRHPDVRHQAVGPDRGPLRRLGPDAGAHRPDRRQHRGAADAAPAPLTHHAPGLRGLHEQPPRRVTHTP